MSFNLSLDETADPQRDVVIEEDGIRFLAEARQRELVDGLRIEIQRVFGREGLVAFNPRLEPGGC
ncbi:MULTISPECIES: hypothetical protein [Anaeromyxobacter]|uniref:hypothetical protein n=1 Tax=Anaeromyxobacter TaxID=161492 RepID=UPI001F5A52D8|nr:MULTISPECIES: hypothetical protein [unclassified Anaeromyxobacter]